MNERQMNDQQLLNELHLLRKEKILNEWSLSNEKHIDRECHTMYIFTTYPQCMTVAYSSIHFG
jgi:hypothetical protein